MLGMIYVAGPMTMGPRESNLRQALEAAERIWAERWVPFVPHLSFFWGDQFEHTWEEWLEYDETVILRCDGLVRLPGESKGADREVAFAERQGIPVYIGVDSFIAANARP